MAGVAKRIDIPEPEYLGIIYHFDMTSVGQYDAYLV